MIFCIFLSEGAFCIVFFWPERELGVDHQGIPWHHTSRALILILIVKRKIMIIMMSGDHLLGSHDDMELVCGWFRTNSTTHEILAQQISGPIDFYEHHHHRYHEN